MATAVASLAGVLSAEGEQTSTAETHVSLFVVRSASLISFVSMVAAGLIRYG